MRTNWFSANKLSLNIGKTVEMKFWNKVSKNHKFKLELNETELPKVALTKFQGVYIDQNLSWESHANYLVEKLNPNKRLLSLGRNLLDKYNLRNVYFGHIHSHLTYRITVWGSMLSSMKFKELQKIQNQCIRIVAKDTTSSISELHRLLQIISIDGMIKQSLCKLGHKITFEKLASADFRHI